MFSFFRTWDIRREWLARRAPEGPMREYFKKPYPWPEDEFRDQVYVALDLETTGLLASEHEIVSIGWVVIRNMHLDLAECGHQLVKPEKGLTSDSATIHGITHDDLAQAPSLEEGLARVLPVLAGRVMIAHHAKVEWKFMNAACRKVYKMPFEIPTVDTMVLEQRLFKARDLTVGKGDMRLDAVRQRYNLPRYRAHNAMIDAISCGELFLAQALHRAGNKGLPLRLLSI